MTTASEDLLKRIDALFADAELPFGHPGRRFDAAGGPVRRSPGIRAAQDVI